MSVTMLEERSSGIALIHCFPSAAADRALPTVILFHSFTVSKEVVSFLGYMIARKGMRCLIPEAPSHGERFDGDVQARQNDFWQICTQYVAEAAPLRDAYRHLMSDPDRVGVAGTSMGGFASLAATAVYDWVGATACFMGSAFFHRSSRVVYPPLGHYDAQNASEHEAAMAGIIDPSDKMERFAHRPIYHWHGQRDDIVHFSNALDMLADLRARAAAETFKLTIDPNGSHRVTDAAAREGIAFLSHHLGVGDIDL